MYRRSLAAVTGFVAAFARDCARYTQVFTARAPLKAFHCILGESICYCAELSASTAGISTSISTKKGIKLIGFATRLSKALDHNTMVLHRAPGGRFRFARLSFACLANSATSDFKLALSSAGEKSGRVASHHSFNSFKYDGSVSALSISLASCRVFPVSK